jgi:predicted small metal-binding protein
MKRIQCGTLVPGCTFTAQAETSAEVVRMEVDHVRDAHRIEVNEGFVSRAQQRIEDIGPEENRPGS